MEARRVIELLDEGKNADWSKYADGRTRKLMCVTFYLLCEKLSKEKNFSCRSDSLSSYITNRISSPFKSVNANPGSHFTQEYTAFVGNEKTDFRPEWSEIVHRDGSQGDYRYVLNSEYRQVVSRYFGQEPTPMKDHQDHRGESETPEEGFRLIELGEDLLWNPPGMMKEVEELLRDKRQLIFYGPPGTGKTYVARALAKHLIGEGKPEDFSQFLQFHPSYSYEDFFEGFRPVRGRNRGMPQFKLVPGPLKKLSEDARKRPDKDHVLIIDEINRGNLAEIFGELYFLLEYRDKKIMLQYGGQPFSLPENLLIIGTMNTADRSISHIDAALRRRFHFFPLFPDEEPNKGLLERYLARDHPNTQLEWVAHDFNSVNHRLKELDGRDGLIGHSYFMPKNPKDLNESWVNRAWRYSIMPLIEDRFIDQPEKAKEFDALRKKRQGDQVSEPV